MNTFEDFMSEVQKKSREIGDLKPFITLEDLAVIVEKFIKK